LKQGVDNLAKAFLTNTNNLVRRRECHMVWNSFKCSQYVENGSNEEIRDEV
jgi:hypothetical protein